MHYIAPKQKDLESHLGQYQWHCHHLSHISAEENARERMWWNEITSLNIFGEQGRPWGSEWSLWGEAGKSMSQKACETGLELRAMDRCGGIWLWRVTRPHRMLRLQRSMQHGGRQMAGERGLRSGDHSGSCGWVSLGLESSPSLLIQCATLGLSLHLWPSVTWRHWSSTPLFGT